MSLIEPVSSIVDSMAVRRIRNANRQWLTGNPKKIGIIEQLHFYLFTPKNIELFVCKNDSGVLGYLLLRQHRHTHFITEVVDKPYRGQGIASKMIRFAQLYYSHLTADILVNNAASIKLHESCGFKIDSFNHVTRTYTWQKL